MRVLSRNRRGRGSKNSWNALLTLMLEAKVQARVMAGLVCGLRASFWGYGLFCGWLVVFPLLGFTFCLSFLVFLVYTLSVREGALRLIFS
jgi:uncharacterized membrane protein